LGRLPEAIAAAKKATELDPLSGVAWWFLGVYLIENRQFAAAHEAVRRALEIQPESAPTQSLLGDLQLYGAHATEALATYRKIDDEGLRLGGVARAEYALGHAKESRQALDELVAKGAQSWPYGIAQIYASCGEKDKAFEWLERAYQRRDTGLSSMRNDIFVASLRGDARFAAMLRRMGLSE
jgi:tetratricopeptide (TPR) repeat protein